MNQPVSPLDIVRLPLSALGMYGTSLGSEASWCMCALCNEPIGGPAAGYTREQAKNDLAKHLVDVHEAEPDT